MWLLAAVGSAFFAGLTAVLAKLGVRETDSDLVTALRTCVVLVMAWAIVLARGYAIVSRAAKPVVSAAQLAAGDAVTIRFADGTAQARIAANTTGED